MKSWADIGFEIEMTRDNSPTLRLLHSVDPERDRGESMHHSAGACGETLLIYGTPARRVFEQISRPSFMVVGLGLGYIEMTIAKEALLLGRSAQDIEKLTSFESIPELREFFYLWLWDQHDKLNSEVHEIYDEALACVLKGSDISAIHLKDFLRVHFARPEMISGALENAQQVCHSYHAIMYDAYSSKTTPHLWDEVFLQSFFARSCAEASIVSTYSGKAEFKEALRKNNFTVVSREAFFGKRKSTVAHRLLQL
jgi:hypothetical protein